MKTQIYNLINGKKNIVRDEEAPKYATAYPATSHNGFAGTNSDIRGEIAAKVAAENEGAMVIKIKGVQITLAQYKSVSGKTWNWTGKIPQGIYATFGGQINVNATEEYAVTVNGDCTVELYKYKKNGGKVKGVFAIDEAFVEII